MTAVDRAGMIARRADLIDEIFRIQGRIAQIDEWLAATPQGGVLDLTTKPPWRRQASSDAQAAQAAQAAPSHAWAARFAQAAPARPAPEAAPAMNGFAEIMADFEAAAAAVDAAVEEPAAAPPPPPPRQRKRRQKRPEGSPRKYSAPSQEALELLERAGDAGLTVKQLADQMRTPIGTAGARLSTLKAFGAARHKKPRYFIRRDDGVGDDVA